MGCYGLELYEDVNLQAVNFVTPQPIADVICYADYTPVSITVKNAGLKEADFSKSPLKVSLDITGAINSGWHSIWINRRKLPTPIAFHELEVQCESAFINLLTKMFVRY